ncbi:MAG: hypothetical protein LUH22_10620 [Bacteroides sp.]|nr:hypothetical protein [Bacteroides sp.]
MDVLVKEKMDKKALLLFAVMIYLLLVALSLVGCSKTVYIPVEHVKTEYRDKHTRDSIHILDSVYLREKGDTVFLTKWRIQYVDRLRHDSILVRDSIPVPYPVEVIREVEQELSGWKTFRLYLGNLFLILTAGYLGWLLLKKKLL